MRAPHDEGDDHTSKRSGSLILRSPLEPAKLNTSASALSLKVSPSDLTQALSSTDPFVEALSKLGMRSPSMPNLFSSSSPGRPPADLHNKLQAETSHRSKTDTMNSVMRTFSASKALNQVLGLRDPEPFVPPPAMPSDLTEKFEFELPRYKQLYAAGVFAPRPSEGFATSAPAQQSKTTLTDILEEKESPVRASPKRDNTISASSKLTISIPKYTSGKQAVAAAQRYTFVDSDSDAVNDTASQHTHYKSDEDYGSWKYGSSTTLVVSDYSRPGSAESGPSLPPPSFPRTSSLLPLPNLSSSDATASPLPHLVGKKLPSGLRPASTRHIAPAASQQFSRKISSYPYIDSSSLKRSKSLPVLLPSPGVVPRSRESVHNDRTSAHRNASRSVEAGDTFDNTSLHFDQNTASSPAPCITIQAPSPVKPRESRKRAPSSTTHEDFGPPLAQRSRREDTSGLPVLPLEAEAEWKNEFPGNTHALLTILLHWSHKMWTLYHRLYDPKLFSIHPAFAYPVTPPVRKQLLSVSFYDTSIEPHKEIRFLGPGDVADMSYHEVDVFEDPKSKAHHSASPRCNSPIDAIKQTFGLTDKEESKHIRYMNMSQRAKTGEGRWCYILIKGNTPPDGSTPPHLILAWHISATTSTSDCLHTIYADDTKPSRAPAPSHNKVKRFSSLQNLGLALRFPAKFNFHQSLRTASSSSELPPADPYATTEQREGVTLHRTVMKMDKAGGIPLIEGYRVDVAAFRNWMEACGRGKGKVLMWRE